jgi:Ca2+-binding EF-hand superfamily protein
MSVISALSSWSAAPKLQKAYMSMMAWSLTNEQHAVFRDSFFALDVDQDGVISIPELTGVMTGTLSMPMEEVTEIVASLGGAEIKYSEFLAAMTLSSHMSLDDDLLQSTFTKFDTGGSGYITTGDLRAVLGSTYEGEDVESLVSQSRSLAANKDDKIDFQEFADCARSYHPGTLLRRAGSDPTENPPAAQEQDEKQVAHDARAVRHVQVSHHGQQACCVLQ